MYIRKFHKGTVVISNPRDSQGEGWVEITVRDENSGVECSVVRLSYEDFGRGLASPCLRPCEFFVNDELVGKKHESKREKVFVQSSDTSDKEEKLEAAKKAIAEYEIDGWIGDTSQVNNMHYRRGYEENGFYTEVVFHRYV